MNNKEIEIIYYNRVYNDYIHNQQLVSDLGLLISQLLSNNKDIKIVEVPSPLKEGKWKSYWNTWTLMTSQNT